jgi:hypothetical protein
MFPREPNLNLAMKDRAVEGIEGQLVDVEDGGRPFGQNDHAAGALPLPRPLALLSELADELPGPVEDTDFDVLPVERPDILPVVDTDGPELGEKACASARRPADD